MDFALSGWLQCLWITAVVLLVLFLLTWAIALRVGRFNVVDTTWGLAFAAVALVAFALASGDGDIARRLTVLAVTVVWGVRLAAHIALRGKGKGEDPRYEEMLTRAGGSRRRAALLVVYLPQAVIAWFVSLPVQVAMFERNEVGVPLFVGLAVWLVGFGFEAVGDAQLERFRNDPAGKGQVMDRGLWRYTRHPNYFGDACQWWGIYLIAAQQWAGALTVLSPLLMTYFLVAKTGAKLLEKDIGERRPGYADYARRTSGFLPLPPRRKA